MKECLVLAEKLELDAQEEMLLFNCISGLPIQMQL